MKKNILYALLANVIMSGLSWILLLFLIRYGNKEDIGIFSLAQAIALPVQLFFTLKLRTIQLSDVNNEFEIEDYFNSRVLLSVLSFIVTIVLSIFLYTNDYRYISAISILGLGYSAVIVREFFISVYQINEKNEYFFVSNIVLGLITTLAFIATYLSTNSILLSIIAFSLSRLLCISVDILILNKFFDEKLRVFISKFKKQKILKLLKVGLPLGVTALIGSLLTSIPRIKLDAEAGLEILGVFTTLMSLVVFFNLFMSSFSQALIPRLSRTYTTSTTEFIKELMLWAVLLFILLFLVLVICYFYSEFILKMIFGVQYIEYSNEFFIAMIAGSILCFFHFTNMMLNVQRSFKSQVSIYAICALVCFIAAYILIPAFELIGAIYTSITTFIVGIVVSLAIFIFNYERSN